MIRTREFERFAVFRRWADEARRGIVTGPLAELERIRLAANMNPELRKLLSDRDEREHYELGAEPFESDVARDTFADAKGALEVRHWMSLLRSLAELRGRAFTKGIQAHYVHGGGGGLRRGSERDVIALAVVVGSLVTIGAKRPVFEGWKRVEWVKPEHVWPEAGSFSRLKSDELGAPLAGRLDEWAAAEAPDRIQVDWATARAVALAIFAEPFDKGGTDADARG